MPTLDQLYGALERADAAGDTAAAQEFAAQIKEQRAATQPQPQAAPKPNPNDDRSFGENLLRGAVGSAATIGRAVATPMLWSTGMLRHPGIKEWYDRSGEIAKDFKHNSGAGGFIGGLATDIAGTAGLGTIVNPLTTRAAAALPGMLGRTLASAPGRAAVEGATAGVVTNPDEPLKGAGIGAAGGVAGQQILSRVLPRVASPINVRQLQDSATLLDEGVPLTVGQAANPNTFGGKAVRWIEESAAGIPFLGSTIKAQREAGRQGFRDVPLQQTAERLQVPVPARGRPGEVSAREMTEQVTEDVGRRYNQLTGGGRNFPMSQVYRGQVNAAIDNPRLSMTPADRMRARSLAEAHLFERQALPGQPAPPATTTLDDIFKGQSDIRQQGYKALQSPLSSERAYGQALIDAADATYAAIQRRFPNIGRQLQDMRAPMADLKTIQKAVTKGGTSGEYTPAMLGKVAEGRGATGLQHWAGMAEPLLTKDPGTISNYARAAILLGAPIAATKGVAAAPLAALIWAGLGTRAGQRTLGGHTAPQRALAQWLADPRNAQTVARAGAILGQQAGTRTFQNEEQY